MDSGFQHKFYTIALCRRVHAAWDWHQYQSQKVTHQFYRSHGLFPLPDLDFCTTQILWKRCSNMFCIIPCSHRVWNLSPCPNLNPSPEVEISRQSPYPYLKPLLLDFRVTCFSFCAATFTLVYNYIISNMYNHEICPIPLIVKCLLFKLKTQFLSK